MSAGVLARARLVLGFLVAGSALASSGVLAEETAPIVLQSDGSAPAEHRDWSAAPFGGLLHGPLHDPGVLPPVGAAGVVAYQAQRGGLLLWRPVADAPVSASRRLDAQSEIEAGVGAILLEQALRDLDRLGSEERGVYLMLPAGGAAPRTLAELEIQRANAARLRGRILDLPEISRPGVIITP